MIRPNSGGALAAALLALFSIQLTDQLSFSSLQMPALVQRNTNFWLSCQFKLEDEDQLYSVKWYKNNEEFYRLFPAAQSEPDQSGGSLATKNQQQYFAQSGVNVLMSSSNATHVRLLNASLESEGSYACEISTQNLSTIRYEKEIRVYALPHSKINIQGLKNRYAIGDQVDLVCSSDFSRPQPALAWFINGQRISTSHWFSSQLQRKNKLNEPTLVRLNLSLKFKLSLDLLTTFGHTNINENNNNNNNHESKPIQANDSRNQANQSLRNANKLRKIQQVANWAKLDTVPATNGAPQVAYQLEPVDKLELKLECKYKLTEVSDVTFNEMSLSQTNVASKPFRRRKRASDGEEEERWMSPASRLSKTADNRVLQWTSPASARDLRLALAGTRAASDACRVGGPVLVPDDPLIVESRREPLVSEFEELNLRARRRRLSENELDNSLGQLISVACSTISAILNSDSGEPSKAEQAKPVTGYCADAAARKRLLISGKHQLAANEDPAGANLIQRARKVQHKTTKERHQLALVSLSESELLDQIANVRSLGNKKLAPEQNHAESWKSHLVVSAHKQDEHELLAPPFLEWFINNMEATKSSSELDPLFEFKAQDGVDSETTTTLLPSNIDYATYFANFDSKPIQQHLLLNLTLQKKHFMTPDSKLRLRCSSTQAQVLASDSVGVSIVAITNEQIQQRSNWLQKPANQHKQLYYQRNGSHQPARSSFVLNNEAKSKASSINSMPLLAFLLILMSAHHHLMSSSTDLVITLSN